MRWLVLATLAGCSFAPTAESTASAPDAAPQITVGDAGSDAAGPPCYAPDTTGLVLCLELDDADLAGGSGIAYDGGPGHHNATVANGTVTTRTVPTSSPAQLISTPGNTPASILVEDSTDFNVAQMTLMAWVDRSPTLTVDEDYGVIEQYPQFVLTVDDSGTVGCSIEGSEQLTYAVLGDTIATNAWALIACTYDGSNVCTLVMPGASGSAASSKCNSAPGPLSGGVQGPVIGAHASTSGPYNQFPGAIDSARMFNRVLTPQEICVGGGRSGC